MTIWCNHYEEASTVQTKFSLHKSEMRAHLKTKHFKQCIIYIQMVGVSNHLTCSYLSDYMNDISLYVVQEISALNV